MSDAIDERIDRIGRFPFRARFHLRAREVAYARERGPEAITAHARDFVAHRLASAEPRNDGKQTPWGGHPVFRAQHATATCCRGCLAKNHDISKGRALDEDQQAYVVAVIMRWIRREMAATASPGGVGSRM